MLFLYINPNAGPDGFCLIIANTRDEFFDRPSRICHFWERNPNIVGGMDFEENRQGGTWLAMHTTGKVSSLLNLVKPASEDEDVLKTKNSRGFLVVNYLESNNEGEAYLRELRTDADLYNEFLLVTVDVRPSLGEVNASYYTNAGGEGPVIMRPGVHVFGNSVPSAPWRKVNAAKQLFENLTTTRPLHTSCKDELLSDLFNLLREDTQHYPDEQLERDVEGHPFAQEYVRQLSAIFIRPELGFYGSRTHTVILVDGRGRVDYVERTMKEPIDIPATDSAEWVTTRMQFTIQDQPASRIVSRL